MIISIDPGKAGAWAVFDHTGSVETTGKFKVPKGQRFFSSLDLDHFKYDALSRSIFVMEAPLDHRMTHQSPVATNTTAINWGIIYGLCIDYGDVDIVRPRDWKKRMGLIGMSKKDSVELAVSLVGEEPLMLHRMRKPNEDIAEAVLIGIDYGRRVWDWT